MNIKKRSVAYAIAVVIYYVFDFLYMPWLVGKFEYGVFLPLGVSILIINFLGVYAYDYFNEDVLFIELGKNWIKDGELGVAKKIAIAGERFPKMADVISFIALSIFPSPIAGYIAFRERIGNGQFKRLIVLAVGSVPCTLVWGGGMTVVWVNLKPVALAGMEFVKQNWL